LSEQRFDLAAQLLDALERVVLEQQLLSLLVFGMGVFAVEVGSGGRGHGLILGDVESSPIAAVAGASPTAQPT